jgi:hypothetical protein
MTTTEPALDTDAISRRQGHAAALLAGNSEGDEYDRDEADLRRLVEDDVRLLLLELERRGVDRDSGYVHGLDRAARWLANFDQDLPDFDRATCRQLARGMRAMLASAEQRLGITAAEAANQ